MGRPLMLRSGSRMTRTTIVMSLVLIAAPIIASAQTGRRPTPRAAATAAGFSRERLARIDRFLQQYVDSGQIAGVVAMVLRDGKVAYQHAAGWSDLESHRPMAINSLFRIASQTKAVTTVASLSLVEEGKIGIDDPVSRWIPQFARTTVATRGDTGRVITPAVRPIT